MTTALVHAPDATCQFVQDIHGTYVRCGMPCVEGPVTFCAVHAGVFNADRRRVSSLGNGLPECATCGVQAITDNGTVYVTCGCGVGLVGGGSDVRPDPQRPNALWDSHRERFVTYDTPTSFEQETP